MLTQSNSQDVSSSSNDEEVNDDENGLMIRQFAADRYGAPNNTRDLKLHPQQKPSAPNPETDTASSLKDSRNDSFSSNAEIVTASQAAKHTQHKTDRRKGSLSGSRDVIGQNVAKARIYEPEHNSDVPQFAVTKKKKGRGKEKPKPILISMPEQPPISATSLCARCHNQPSRWYLSELDDGSEGWLCHTCHEKEAVEVVPREPVIPKSRPADGRCECCLKLTPALTMKTISERLWSCEKCYNKHKYQEKQTRAETAAAEGWTKQPKMSKELVKIMERYFYDTNMLLVALRDEMYADWTLIQEFVARSERRVESVYKLKQRYAAEKKRQQETPIDPALLGE